MTTDGPTDGRTEGRNADDGRNGGEEGKRTRDARVKRRNQREREEKKREVEKMEEKFSVCDSLARACRVGAEPVGWLRWGRFASPLRFVGGSRGGWRDPRGNGPWTGEGRCRAAVIRGKQCDAGPVPWTAPM